MCHSELTFKLTKVLLCSTIDWHLFTFLFEQLRREYCLKRSDFKWWYLSSSINREGRNWFNESEWNLDTVRHFIQEFKRFKMKKVWRKIDIKNVKTSASFCVIVDKSVNENMSNVAPFNRTICSLNNLIQEQYTYSNFKDYWKI